MLVSPIDGPLLCGNPWITIFGEPVLVDQHFALLHGGRVRRYDQGGECAPLLQLSFHDPARHQIFFYYFDVLHKKSN